MKKPLLHSIQYIALLLAFALVSITASAQQRKREIEQAGRRGAGAQEVLTNRVQAKNDKSEQRERLTLDLTLANVFSSNIELDDEDPIRSYGFIPSARLRYSRYVGENTIEADYRIRSYSYTDSDRYDRIAHDLRATHGRRVARRWRMETTGAFSLNGRVADERRTGNEYSVSQRWQYRFESRRLNFFGGFRARRFRDDNRNAKNPFVGGSFAQRLRGGRRFEAGYRYDWNIGESSRRTYQRQTYAASFSTPLDNRNALIIGGRYRPQEYKWRIRAEGVGTNQKDHRWDATAAWERELKRNLGFHAFYSFERRRSNDSDRNFNEHLTGVALTYRWRIK